MEKDYEIRQTLSVRQQNNVVPSFGLVTNIRLFENPRLFDVEKIIELILYNIRHCSNFFVSFVHIVLLIVEPTPEVFFSNWTTRTTQNKEKGNPKPTT